MYSWVMCVDIGVQPQGNRGYRLFFAGQLFDDGHSSADSTLKQNILLSSAYSISQSAFPTPAIQSFGPGIQPPERPLSRRRLRSRPYSRSGNQSQYLGIGIGFDGIVYLKIPFFGQAGKCRECIVQQRLIVIIKRSFFLIEMSNRKHVSQKVKCHAEHILHDTVL